MKSRVVKEVSFKVNSLTLAGKMWGDDKGQPVIALHGWLDNANSFDYLAPCFPNLNICALDMAGHGFSDHRPGWGQYSTYEYIFDVLEIAKLLGWNKFSIIGHSMGTHIGLIMAALMPELIDKVFLIEGFGIPIRQPASEVPGLVKGAYLKTVGLKDKQAPIYPSIDAMVETRKKALIQINEAAARLLCERSVKKQANGYTWRNDPRLKFTAPLKVNHEEICEYVKRIEAPTCLVFGDEGPNRDKSLIDERIALHRDIQVHRFRGGHHLHMEDDYMDVARVMAQFFDVPLMTS
ncbi:MAG: alpha/beta hydrolase [Pseudomonadales bacterium]|nr:alpha/beta hydrolase [Pseudomonadales bacterium]